MSLNNNEKVQKNIKCLISSSVNTLLSNHITKFSQSNPDLLKLAENFETTLQFSQTHSENDVTKILNNLPKNNRLLLNGKSEISLKTISVHNTNKVDLKNVSSKQIKKLINKTNFKMSTSRSNCELGQSSYSEIGDTLNGAGCISENVTTNRRRMSENSLSGYSQRSYATNNSANIISASYSEDYDVRSGCSDNNNSLVRVPIIGYEVMEERARFTVYKLRVENPFTNNYWLVLRRYTDFVRLNTKLKQAFPNISLHLPRKKIFGDNFNSVFLENRVQGLQIFVNSIMSNEELRKFKIVREFFCLDEPPSYSESMEECRAIFEAQEETISDMKMQINSKNDLILNLQRKLQETIAEKEDLQETIKNMSVKCSKCARNIVGEQ